MYAAITQTEQYILLGIIVLIIISLILLKTENRLIYRLINSRKVDRNTYFNQRLKQIQITSDSKETVKKINELARGFFKEAFGSDYDSDCSALEKKFAKVGKKDCQDFCDWILNMQYSTKTVSEEEIENLKAMLKEIINNYSISDNPSNNIN